MNDNNSSKNYICVGHGMDTEHSKYCTSDCKRKIRPEHICKFSMSKRKQTGLLAFSYIFGWTEERNKKKTIVYSMHLHLQ